MAVTKLIFLGTALLVILAGCGGGGGGPSGGTIPVNPGGINIINQPPAITSVSPSGTTDKPFSVQVNSQQHLTAAATDPDNDTLTWTWTTDQGQITPHGSQADLAVPGTACTVCVTATADDGHGHQVSVKTYLSVKSGADNPPPPPTNSAPVIASLTADPTSVDLNGTSTLTVSASDPDGDSLTYSWNADGGTLESQSGATATWKAPATAGTSTITVSVSDGVNPAVTKSISISAGGGTQPGIVYGLKATYIQNDGNMAHPDLDKGQIVFTELEPTINFDWDRHAPDPRLITDPATGNGHDWGIIWQGYIRCEQPGVYQFEAYYDDGFRLWISDDQNNMQLVIDGWNTGPTLDAPVPGSISLQGGKWYKFEARMFEDEDRSYCQLFWQAPGATGFTVVPSDSFRVP